MDTTATLRQANAMPEDIMTAKELATYLKTSVRTVIRRAQQGVLPGAKIGREWRFRKVDIDEWLARGGVLADRSQARLRF